MEGIIMTVNTTSASFISDYTYASKKHHDVIEKYRGYFNDVFRLDLASFFYERWYPSGEYFSVNSSQHLQELFIETQGFEDSPFCTEYSKFRSQNAFAYKDQDTNNLKHNKFRHALEQQNINLTFFITERHPTYCQVIGWDLFTSKNQLSIVESQSVVLQDCINNAKKLKACFNQFKKEVLLPVTKNKDLCRVNLKDIKKDKYKTQEFMLDSTKNEIKRAILSAGIFEKRALMLDRIKFTPTEIRILDYYLQNMSVKEIAAVAKLSHEAVERQINSIKVKLDIKKN
jgi:DNA-binding CsgD family transcriptional regulator